MKKTLTILILAASCQFAQAQDSWLNVLRSDIRTQVSALVETAMEFSDAEADVFWPIYREYELELSKITDERIALIKDYAANFGAMTDEKADEIVNASQKLAKRRNDLDVKYYKKVRKVLTGVRAARFFQVNRQIEMLLDLQIASELPLVEEPLAEPQEDDEGME